MCGPTGTEKQESFAAQQYAQRTQANYNQLFGEQQGVISSLNSAFSPIVAAGPSQTGFSAPELAALNTQAINTTGANYANAARALNNQLAGRGGNSGLESGVDADIKAGLASSAAGQLSNEQLGITEANYAQGRQNWQQAAAGLQALGGMENPTGAGGLGVSANNSAFDMAQTIAQQQAQEAQAIGGAIGSVAGAGLTFASGALGGGGLQGGLQALSGGGFGGGGGAPAGVTQDVADIQADQAWGGNNNLLTLGGGSPEPNV